MKNGVSLDLGSLLIKLNNDGCVCLILASLTVWALFSSLWDFEPAKCHFRLMYMWYSRLVSRLFVFGIFVTLCQFNCGWVGRGAAVGVVGRDQAAQSSSAVTLVLVSRGQDTRCKVLLDYCHASTKWCTCKQIQFWTCSEAYWPFLGISRILTVHFQLDWEGKKKEKQHEKTLVLYITFCSLNLLCLQCVFVLLITGQMLALWYHVQTFLAPLIRFEKQKIL